MEGENKNIKYLEVQIFGRVQGVGFRYFIKRQASKIGMRGFCKNLEDGSVLVNVSGENQILKDFLKKLHKGPLFARVDHLEIKEIPEFEAEAFKVI